MLSDSLVSINLVNTEPTLSFFAKLVHLELPSQALRPGTAVNIFRDFQLQSAYILAVNVLLAIEVEVIEGHEAATCFKNIQFSKPSAILVGAVYDAVFCNSKPLKLSHKVRFVVKHIYDVSTYLIGASNGNVLVVDRPSLEDGKLVSEFLQPASSATTSEFTFNTDNFFDRLCYLCTYRGVVWTMPIDETLQMDVSAVLENSDQVNRNRRDEEKNGGGGQHSEEEGSAQAGATIGLSKNCKVICKISPRVLQNGISNGDDALEKQNSTDLGETASDSKVAQDIIFDPSEHKMYDKGNSPFKLCEINKKLDLANMVSPQTIFCYMVGVPRNDPSATKRQEPHEGRRQSDDKRNDSEPGENGQQMTPRPEQATARCETTESSEGMNATRDSADIPIRINGTNSGQSTEQSGSPKTNGENNGNHASRKPTLPSDGAASAASPLVGSTRSAASHGSAAQSEGKCESALRPAAINANLGVSDDNQAAARISLLRQPPPGSSNSPTWKQWRSQQELSSPPAMALPRQPSSALTASSQPAVATTLPPQTETTTSIAVNSGTATRSSCSVIVRKGKPQYEASPQLTTGSSRMLPHSFQRIPPNSAQTIPSSPQANSPPSEPLRAPILPLVALNPSNTRSIQTGQSQPTQQSSYRGPISSFCEQSATQMMQVAVHQAATKRWPTIEKPQSSVLMPPPRGHAPAKKARSAGTRTSRTKRPYTRRTPATAGRGPRSSRVPAPPRAPQAQAVARAAELGPGPMAVARVPATSCQLVIASTCSSNIYIRPADYYNPGCGQLCCSGPTVTFAKSPPRNVIAPTSNAGHGRYMEISSVVPTNAQQAMGDLVQNMVSEINQNAKPPCAPQRYEMASTSRAAEERQSTAQAATSTAQLRAQQVNREDIQNAVVLYEQDAGPSSSVKIAENRGPKKRALAELTEDKSTEEDAEGEVPQNNSNSGPVDMRLRNLAVTSSPSDGSVAPENGSESSQRPNSFSSPDNSPHSSNLIIDESSRHSSPQSVHSDRSEPAAKKRRSSPSQLAVMLQEPVPISRPRIEDRPSPPEGLFDVFTQRARDNMRKSTTPQQATNAISWSPNLSRPEQNTGRMVHASPQHPAVFASPPNPHPPHPHEMQPHRGRLSSNEFNTDRMMQINPQLRGSLATSFGDVASNRNGANKPMSSHFPMTLQQAILAQATTSSGNQSIVASSSATQRTMVDMSAFRQTGAMDAPAQRAPSQGSHFAPNSFERVDSMANRQKLLYSNSNTHHAGQPSGPPMPVMHSSLTHRETQIQPAASASQGGSVPGAMNQLVACRHEHQQMQLQQFQQMQQMQRMQSLPQVRFLPSASSGAHPIAYPHDGRQVRQLNQPPQLPPSAQFNFNQQQHSQYQPYYSMHATGRYGAPPGRSFPPSASHFPPPTESPSQENLAFYRAAQSQLAQHRVSTPVIMPPPPSYSPPQQLPSRPIASTAIVPPPPGPSSACPTVIHARNPFDDSNVHFVPRSNPLLPIVHVGTQTDYFLTTPITLCPCSQRCLQQFFAEQPYRR